MKSFKTFIFEEHQISFKELVYLEKELDKLFARIGVDVEFTRHFLDRVNDERNKKQITIEELAVLFAKVFREHKNKLNTGHIDWQAVMTDISTDINVPFILKWNKRQQELELVAKTTMRKKNFKTSNDKLVVK